MNDSPEPGVVVETSAAYQFAEALSHPAVMIGLLVLIACLVGYDVHLARRESPIQGRFLIAAITAVFVVAVSTYGFTLWEQSKHNDKVVAAIEDFYDVTIATSVPVKNSVVTGVFHPHRSHFDVSLYYQGTFFENARVLISEEDAAGDNTTIRYALEGSLQD